MTRRAGPATGARLARDFFAADPVQVAPTLLGCLLVCRSPEGLVAVRLTEVEAYRGEREDPGSHAFRGPTRRTEVMFGRAGHLYVYFTYGMHWCANVVCGPDGIAGAVLLRAGEVIRGHELAAERREPSRREADLARGPARLTRACGIDSRHGGADLCAVNAQVWLEPGPDAPDPTAVRRGPRVGVSGAGGDGQAFPWRFWLDGDPTVSAYRAAKPARPRPA